MDKNRLTIRLNIEIYLFIFFYLFSTFYSFIRVFSDSKTILVCLLAMVLYLFLFFYYIKKYKNIVWSCIVLFLLVLGYILFCMGKYNYPIYTHINNGVFPAILTGYSSLYALLFIGIYRKAKDLNRALFYTAIINYFLQLIRLVIIILPSENLSKTGYDMDFGYKMLFSCIVFLSIYLENKEKRYIWLFLSSIVLMIYIGSRGPILCVLVYLFLYFLIFEFNKSTFRRKIIICIIFIFGLAIAYIYYNYIAVLIDFSSLPRSIQTVLNFRFSDGTNESRIRIANRIEEFISNNGFWGSGLLSDQANLGPGMYSHNIFLEFQITFGKLPGLFVFVIIVLQTIRLLKSKYLEDDYKRVFIVFVALLCRLLVSYSFWYDINFWCFISLMLVLSKIARNNKKHDLIGT